MKYRPAESILNPFFEDFLRSELPTQEADLIPRCDVLERKNDYVIYAELPGAVKENLKVEYQNHLLTISGQKKPVLHQDSERFYRTERLYGTFSRSFRVGEEIDTGKINAEYENGVLEVTLPKTEKAQPKTVDIQVK
jgi:HSP20 family protein